MRSPLLKFVVHSATRQNKKGIIQSYVRTVNSFVQSEKLSVQEDNKEPKQDSVGELRKSIAPWVRIGVFQKGLMSHLSTFEILRSLSVLKFCSYDFFMDRTMQFLNLYKKLGFLLEWPVRKTFFNQFVGGDTVPRMNEVVGTLHKRGVRLMFCPLVEEDLEDKRSPSKFYDDNLKELMDLVEFTSTLEKDRAIFQLKPTALIPAVTLEYVSKEINSRCKYNEPLKLTHLVEELAESVVDSEELKFPRLDKLEASYFFDGLRRADALIKRAKELSVHVIVDAEFYSCKPAISALTLALMARHNEEGPFVGNTIQTYLREALCTIRAELEVVTVNLGVNWFGKIVRGAYMDRERELAKQRHYPSPIWDSYDETSRSYNASVQTVLEHIAEHEKSQTHLVVAGHNERSIRMAAQKMKDLGLKNGERVSFAQIYGMADYLSTPLVKEGYNVYKSTPYGPIEGVLPYLARRASENRSVMKGARDEREMLKRELKQRFI